MRSILDQLETNESLLLMYLSDELPAADRLEVEKRLAADEGLRAEFEQLRAAQETMVASFRALDEANPLPGTAAATQRKLSRAIHQWQAVRLRAQASQPAKPAALWRRLGWAYPWAAAAAFLIGYIVWWGTQPASDQTLPPNAQASADYDNTDGRGFGYGYGYGRPPSTQDVLVDAEKQTLADAEQEVETVGYLRELTVTQ